MSVLFHCYSNCKVFVSMSVCLILYIYMYQQACVSGFFKLSLLNFNLKQEIFHSIKIPISFP